MSPTSFFKNGGRYRNRIGWYEVLDVADDYSKIKIRYEHSGAEEWLSDLQILERISKNIEREENRQIPYDDEGRNIMFFTTIGYLIKNSFIEAIIPYKSKAGFDEHYFKIKGRYPREGQNGYYIHRDYNVDKWGVEMRLTFNKPRDKLNFPENLTVVESPDPAKLRINSNTFCYDLLNRGFDLGDNQDIELIESIIPDKYANAFLNGLSSR